MKYIVWLRRNIGGAEIDSEAEDQEELRRVIHDHYKDHWVKTPRAMGSTSTTRTTTPSPWMFRAGGGL